MKQVRAGIGEIEKGTISILNIGNIFFPQYEEISYHFGQNSSVQDEIYLD